MRCAVSQCPDAHGSSSLAGGKYCAHNGHDRGQNRAVGKTLDGT